MNSQSHIGTLLIAAALSAAGSQAACTEASSIPPDSAVTVTELPYRIQAPDTVIRLPKKLTEISGLTWLGNGRIGAVNDEDGDLFVVDAVSGRIVEKIRFAGGGDYEGVERSTDAIYVLRSDGRLYEIHLPLTSEVAVDRHNSEITQNCDAEGLAFEPGNGDLLIACKEHAGKNLKGRKAVYRYSLQSGKIGDRPAIIIDALDPSLTLSEGSISRSVRRFFKIPRFKPSGIAIHPFTDELYVLSSRSHGVAVFGTDGQLRNSSFLDPEIFQQPEGIAFAPDGTLYISSEGRTGPGILARFEYRPSNSP